MTTIRDFIYLDFQRLRSFASQVLDEGIPSSTTRSDTKGAEFGGELKGRIPMVIEGGANTKGVMSATSTVTSELHHQLVTRVLDGLSAEGLLWPESQLEDAPDGAFVSLRAQIQISDPDSLRVLVEKMPDLSRSLRLRGHLHLHPAAARISEPDVARRSLNPERSREPRRMAFRPFWLRSRRALSASA